MWRMPNTAVMAVCALGFMLSMGAHGAFAASSSAKIPAGAKVEIKGNTAMMRNGSGGLTGTFSCQCISGKAGTCKLTTSTTTLQCSSTGGSCAGDCIVSISTTGINRMSPAAKSR